MGYDMSYHPISKEQIDKWYFDILDDINLVNSLKVRVPSSQLEKGLGILEASDVVEPHPSLEEEPACYSNLFNCDFQGISLYYEAVMEQLESLKV